MYRTLVLALLLLAVSCGRRSRRAPAPAALAYPDTRTVAQVDDYHGIEVADPYRWLEDSNSPDVADWIEDQNELTRTYLDRSRARPRIRRRLERLMDYDRYTVPFTRGGRYFYQMRKGLQAQPVLFVADELGAEPRVLVDPNDLSREGTVSLSGAWPSWDGRLLAFGLSEGGSDWKEIKVVDVETGEETEDHLRWIKFSDAAWAPDDSGFFYSRLPEPVEGTKLTAVVKRQRIYFHRLGTPQDDDALVYERPDQPRWGLGADVSEDGAYLVIGAWDGATSNNGLFVKDLERDSPVLEILNAFDAEYGYLGNDGPVFWVWTNKDAPKGRIVAIDLRDPRPEAWTELVPEGKWPINWVDVVGDRFAVQYLRLAHAQVRIFSLDGSFEREVELPTLGTTWGFTGLRSDRETFYVFSGLTYPPAIFRYDFGSGKSRVFRRADIDVDPDKFEARQVVYRSRDGTQVTMFLAHKKGLKLDGNNPALLYGYGGFGISTQPWFSVSNVVWMEMGGVYAAPNIRGGGEWGEEWHETGSKRHKQNSFDDFMAAAERLIDNGYTSPSKLAITGSSNGGLLVGACVTQRPELFGACVASRGVMDMLRFHKFTIGWGWIGEFGSSEDPDDFAVLRSYSPYHNLRPGTRYPATLITTGDHDDRVVPGHSYKFAARMQACQAGNAPVLLRVATAAGHGAGTATQKRIDETADWLAFLAENLGMRVRRRIR